MKQRTKDTETPAGLGEDGSPLLPTWCQRHWKQKRQAGRQAGSRSRGFRSAEPSAGCFGVESLGEINHVKQEKILHAGLALCLTHRSRVQGHLDMQFTPF